MNTPAILFGTILACFLGSAFHFITGGGLGRLFLFLGTSMAGFWLGQYIADRLNWDLLSFGALHLDLAIISALILLLAAFWLTHTTPPQKG